ncbi:MAG TPA: polysaccharide deacetylase family protein [Xanthomonadaceae bacterium]|nr:polysaccharide deacetylase family protein [Xanthomonadaceae bacterium]
MLKDLTRRFLYASGALPLYHRIRNTDTLTVVMFHRTLSADDPRWATCDPDYTLPREVFAQVIGFVHRHYNVVSVEQVLDARAGHSRLPPRALLLTFDDGWADNVDHALPELQRAGLPGLMFVVADAVGRRQPFWQEQLIAAWRRGALRVAELASALESIDGAGGSVRTPAGNEDLASLRKLIALIEDMPRDDRSRLLAPFAAAMDDGLRHMVDAHELERLRAGGVALGLHGKTHVPMTQAEDLDAELDGARASLAASLQAGTPGDSEKPARTMSFPHGAFDMDIAARARQAGYELLFTSVPVLNPTRQGPGWLLGRTGFETDTVVDRHRRFRGDWLAWYLFRRPTRSLA